MIPVDWSDSFVVLTNCQCWQSGDFDWLHLKPSANHHAHGELGTFKHPWIPCIIFPIWASASVWQQRRNSVVLFWHSFVSLTRGILFTDAQLSLLSLHANNMDLQSALPCATIFHELQTVHETGFFYSLPSLEDDWAQVCFSSYVFSEFVLSYPACMWPLNEGLTLKRKCSDRRTAFILRKSAMFTSFRIPCVFHFRARKLYCTISCVLFSLHRRGSKWIVTSVQSPLLWKAKTQT